MFIYAIFVVGLGRCADIQDAFSIEPTPHPDEPLIASYEDELGEKGLHHLFPTKEAFGRPQLIIAGDDQQAYRTSNHLAAVHYGEKGGFPSVAWHAHNITAVVQQYVESLCTVGAADPLFLMGGVLLIERPGVPYTPCLVSGCAQGPDAPSAVATFLQRNRPIGDSTSVVGSLFRARFLLIPEIMRSRDAPTSVCVSLH